MLAVYGLAAGWRRITKSVTSQFTKTSTFCSCGRRPVGTLVIANVPFSPVPTRISGSGLLECDFKLTLLICHRH
jgi:hypothetical protein